MQGLGFVGSAMAVACSQAKKIGSDEYLYDVVGLDLETPVGSMRIESINKGIFPFSTVDQDLVRSTAESFALGNLRATSDTGVLKTAEIVVVDVHLDVNELNGVSIVETAPFTRAIETLGQNIPEGCLVLIETTVPPGTCKSIVAPILASCALSRGFTEDAFMLAHAYERVMPGKNYLASVKNFWRVFAADTSKAADCCEEFLATVVNVEDYPLTRLSSTVASETAKILENTYRAVNIALLDEWGKFAEKIGVDMFEVVEAIRKRPTHSNIRQPGFGVGGYCLTKDALFVDYSAKEIFDISGLQFPLSFTALDINKEMPKHALAKLRLQLGGLSNCNILLAGVSYRQDVADTRYSPSQTFYEVAVSEGANVIVCDALVEHWGELNLPVLDRLPEKCPAVDAVVFAVPHREYRAIDPSTWLGRTKPYILDCNNCLTLKQRERFLKQGCPVESVGRG